MRLEERFASVLDRRLRSRSDRPLAVALSGGGDSLALLILTVGWATTHGRRVVALVFDHGLNPASAEWTRFAVETAQRHGAQARALTWEGSKPTTGVPAAARAARHAALAQAAREAGAAVLLMGHTADDRLEAAAMRAEGSTVSDPFEWAPSPAWPEGRSVFVLRPLLDQRREDLRAFLCHRGETWVDDPANEDRRYARARARASLHQSPSPPPAAPPPVISTEGWREAHGALETTRPVRPLALAAACLCVSGWNEPPSAASLARLLAQLEAGSRFAATLAGSRVAWDGQLLVTRETGRRPPPVLSLPAAIPTVWDGRYLITARHEGTGVLQLGGLAGRLSKRQREALGVAPVAARPLLPVLVDRDGRVVCPVLAEGEELGTASSLIMDRFEAACGQIAAEPA